MAHLACALHYVLLQFRHSQEKQGLLPSFATCNLRKIPPPFSDVVSLQCNRNIPSSWDTAVYQRLHDGLTLILQGHANEGALQFAPVHLVSVGPATLPASARCAQPPHL